MRLPDNSWSPLVFWSLAFLLKILRLVLKRQCLLQCFRNVELIEMPLLPHNRLKEWVQNIYVRLIILKSFYLIFHLSAGKKPTENPTKKKYTLLKKNPKPNKPQKTQTKSEKTTSSDILGLNCKWYVHPNYYSRSLSKLLEKTSTLQITL